MGGGPDMGGSPCMGGGMDMGSCLRDAFCPGSGWEGRGKLEGGGASDGRP